MPAGPTSPTRNSMRNTVKSTNSNAIYGPMAIDVQPAAPITQCKQTKMICQINSLYKTKSREQAAIHWIATCFRLIFYPLLPGQNLFLKLCQYLICNICTFFNVIQITNENSEFISFKLTHPELFASTHNL